MKSKKRIAWQKGHWATYAEVAVKLETGGNEYDVAKPEGIDRVDPSWRAGVLYGLALLREKLPGVNVSNKVRVTITLFRGQPSDTTATAAAYVVFHAVAQEIAPELLNDFTFDEETAEYVITSPRMT